MLAQVTLVRQRIVDAQDFKRWRKALRLSQKEAADALGLKRRVVQYYEKGNRDGKEVIIPKTVRLACYALSVEMFDYHGPEVRDKDRKKEKKRHHDRAEESV